MFTLYEYYLLAKNPQKSLYSELEEQFKDKDPLDIMYDFKNFSECYKEKIYDAKEKILYPFWYLRWSMYWKAILCTALTVDYPNFDELAFSLRRFYYLYWDCG